MKVKSNNAVMRATLGAALSLILLCGCALAAAPAIPGAVSPVRIVHVSPQVLANIPPGQQFRSISQAAAVVEPGDCVLIHSGIYREKVVLDHSGTRERPICFQAVACERVVVTGADLLTNWEKEPAGGQDNLFSTVWTGSNAPAHPEDDYHLMIGRSAQVFIDGYPLQQVLHRQQLARGTFYIDAENHRLYVQASSNIDIIARQSPVEVSVRGAVWQVTGDYMHTRGIIVRYAANAAQHGAAFFNGTGDWAEDCVFERTNGVGASFGGTDLVVRRCAFLENGQMGWGSYGSRHLLVSDCLTARNNTKNFSRDWEAGGCKICASRDCIIEHCRFEDNHGCGLWFDISNQDPQVRNCLLANNEDAGLFYEISYGLHAHDNVILGNGFASGRGQWGADGGLSLSSSPGCLIERNLLIGNKEGFQFREQPRTTRAVDAPSASEEVPVWNHDQIIRHNIFAFNRDAQVWGWFDVHDQRHWPAAMQENQPGAAGATAGDKAKGAHGHPTGFSLEKLNIRFEANLYATLDAQGLFNWGPGFARHKAYPSLDTVQKELNLEQGSAVERLVFADPLRCDFRVPADSPALKSGNYPRGEVPGVRLGTITPPPGP